MDARARTGFSIKDSPTMRQQSMRRVGTIARAPLEGGKKDKDKDGKLTGSEVRRHDLALPPSSSQAGSS